MSYLEILSGGDHVSEANGSGALLGLALVSLLKDAEVPSEEDLGDLGEQGETGQR